MSNSENGPYYVMSNTKNVHLLRERQKTTFDIEKLTQFIYSDYFEVDARRKLSRQAYDHPIHDTHLPLEYLDSNDYYETLVRKSIIATDEAEKLGISDSKHLMWYLGAFTEERVAFSLHLRMFVPTIVMMATDEQYQQYLELAKKFKIIGTYCQTELGHGSDLRRLETIAVFEHSSDSFIIDTPTITATKFWPGYLGRTANYVILMAQLYTNGKNCGLQPFLVQIRDFNTHEPLPGIEVGEISGRLAHEAGDNGYLRLTNVRIPRNQMLMRLANVDRNGNFTRLGDSRLVYATMLTMRVSLCAYNAILLARATTIAIRYSAVRYQGQNDKGNEMQILDYPLQQDKLFPCLATSYAFICSFSRLNQIYENVMASKPDEILQQLPDIHSLSAGLKAMTSSISERMSQICRLSCGGHGYLISSGLVGIRLILDAGCTYEGDNSVLLQQTAKYLLKMYQQCENGEELISPTVAYLKETATIFSPISNISNLEYYCKIFELRARRLIKDMYTKLLEIAASTSQSPYETFLENSIELVHIARCHMETFIIRSFYDKIKVTSDSSVQNILNQLFELFAVYTLLQNQTYDFVKFTILSADTIELLKKRYQQLCTKIRPNAVGLVDAFDFHDKELNSVLGQYDGDVYEALLERARLNPSNKTKIHPAWNNNLLSLMKERSKL
ncbi:unnamed protein product [Didymodactylos carnosus]|uniref:Acyl-coenzyme A oxidase n=1 Tax=Didymodactylos carnosus TaxID=1234261 RepID=A0A813WRE4_9BILA|nr:unnamed protein product [Didymodactylos carnosus]CAF1209717.1 unnamed protein product [Didymodactylos carnosus]CAF3642655.1 unnamed protein product [Didymodactylos carnosus]CAF4018773.1 unnamed protein product [Didymodactylos carnosus]